MNLGFSDLSKYITINEASEEAFIAHMWAREWNGTGVKTTIITLNKYTFVQLDQKNTKMVLNSSLFGLHSRDVLECSTGVAALIVSSHIIRRHVCLCNYSLNSKISNGHRVRSGYEFNHFVTRGRHLFVQCQWSQPHVQGSYTYDLSKFHDFFHDFLKYSMT